MLQGTLLLAGQLRPVRITRTQNEDGESLEIALDGGRAVFTWNGKDGARSGSDSITGGDRALVERIALDSPDQFIQAQLRGAAYFTVAQSVRPAEAGGDDNYAGPTWDLVRVAEPEHFSTNKPLSLWRLYFLNTQTGLIDRIVSQEDSATITAEITAWTKQGDEIVPARIIWRKQDQVVMELAINNVSHSPKQ